MAKNYKTMNGTYSKERVKDIKTMIDGEDRDPNELSIGDRANGGFHGVALAYVLTADNQECVTAPYDYALYLDLDPNYQMRAYRQDRRLRGKTNKLLPDNALKDEVIVIPGAGMSPEDVLTALLKMIRAIQEEGLTIGKTQKNYYCAERIGIVPRFVDYENPKVAIEDT